MSRIRTLAVAALAAALTAAPLAAQSSASASLAVTGKIVNPIALAVTAPLDFGGMFVGTPKSIAPDGTGGGRFNVSGEAGAAISVTLQMPTAVSTTGGATIPLSNWSYVVGSSAALTGVTPVSFNPTAGTPISASLGGTTGVGHVYFGVGATATPSAAAPGGTYSATGQITVAYVGM
jgi:hypothetical protein